MLTIRDARGGVHVDIRAQPKASRQGIRGLVGDRLKVAVTAAPADGKANAAIVKVVAKALGVRPSAVEITAGHASRDKTLRIAGLSREAARRRLAEALGDPQGRPHRARNGDQS